MPKYRARAVERCPWLAISLAGAILLAWCWGATAVDQSVLAVQNSRLLMTVGAVNGESLEAGQWWRIATSQFLHVHFLHMLFNAACVAVVAASIEQRHGAWKVALVCVAGGSAGQVASVLSYPDLVSSGASQALMALAGASLVLPASSRPRRFALGVVAIQLALDIYVADKIKAGHGFGFLAGVLIGAAFRRRCGEART